MKSINEMKQISYSLALEVDRTLDLRLNNGRYETLVSFIDGYQDSQEITKELLLSNAKAVQNIIDNHQTK
jgi:hypothetical protein